MSVDVVAAIQDLLASIFGSREAAIEFLQDPNGVAAEYGLTDADYSAGVNVDAIAYQASTAQYAGATSGAAGATAGSAAATGYASPASAAVQSYVADPHPAAASYEEVIQQIQQVTVVNYEGDTTVIEQLTTIDNSLNIDGNVNGDIDVDSLVQGDGSVGNTGDGADVNGATGDGAIASVGNNGVQNTGDGAVLADGDIEGPVNTGTFTGIQNDDGTVDSGQLVIGDGNAGLIGPENSGSASLNFGDGNTNVQDSSLEDAAVGPGAQNLSNNDVDEGGALAGDDASGFNVTEDNDVDNSDNSVDQSDNGVDNSTSLVEDNDNTFDNNGDAQNEANDNDDLDGI